MTEKYFTKNEVIFREGERGESFFLISEGTVGIYVNYGSDDQQKLAELKKDQCFGEMAVIESYPRSATAVAEDDVKAEEIPSGEILKYFESDPDKVIDMMKYLGKRIRELNADYIEVCDTIEELRSGDGSPEHQSGLIDRIKRFVKYYRLNGKAASVESVEALRKIEGSSHSDGFFDNVESYTKGTVIFKEGETGNCMYDIHFGEIGIYRNYGTPNEKLLSKLPMNRFFGEMALLENCPRTATAVVLADDTTLEMIDTGSLMDIFKKNLPKIEMILAHLSYRLRSLTDGYLEACRLVSDISDAEKSGQLSEELKKKAEELEIKICG